MILLEIYLIGVIFYLLMGWTDDDPRWEKYFRQGYEVYWFKYDTDWLKLLVRLVVSFFWPFAFVIDLVIFCARIKLW